MAHEIGIRALKQNASAVVARTAAGETVTVTDRGADYDLAPGDLVDQDIRQTNADPDAFSGEARPPRRPSVDLAYPRHDVELSEELAAMREAERY